jgi:CBS domain-containing protein
MLVKEVMTADVETVEPDMPVREAAKRMEMLDVGAFVVSHVYDLHGVLTDRDLVVRVLAKDLDPDKTLVRDIMTRESVFCYDDDDLHTAAAAMESNNVRRIAVLKREDSRLAGILSLVDIAAAGDDPSLCAAVLPKVSGARG